MAAADIVPVADNIQWGVVDRIPPQQRNDNLLIKDMIVSRDRVYVGGYFLNVQRGDGPKTSQPFLAAFERSTGQWDENFRPNVSGPVEELLLSPDGSRLFVAGDFDSINGDTGISGLAALDPVTGAVQQDFRVDVAWEYAQETMTVDALATDGTFLYFGGRFSRVTTTNATNAYRNRIAAVRLNNGTLTGFNPQARGGLVASMAVDTARGRLYVGGSFDSIDGVANTPEFASIDLATGNLTAGVQQGIRIQNQIERFRNFHYPYDIEVFDGHVAWAGDQHMEVMRASDLRNVFSDFIRNQDCNSPGNAGDVQALEFVDGALYYGGHFRRDAGCRITDIIASWTPGSSTNNVNFDIEWGVDSPSIWALETDPVTGALWGAGNFTIVGGTPANSLIRFPSDQSVLDTERPGIPGRVVVAGTSDTSVDLTWAAASDNVGVTEYQVFRSEQSGVLGPRVATAATNSFSDTGLAPNVTYYYAVKAVDGAGNVGFRTGLTAATTVAQADSERPTPPSSAPVVSANGNDVQISWGAATDNVGVVGYQVYRSDAGGPFAVVATPAGTTYTDAGLATGDYRYYIRAFDAAGNVGFRTGIRSVTVTGGPAGPDTERPVPARRFRWVTRTTDSVDLAWDAAVDNVGVVQYDIFDNANRQVIATVDGSTLSTTITGLTPGTDYAFFVKATDAAGNQSFRSNLATFTTR